MNENLDLTKILEGCPKGTKFYSSIFGEISFVKMHNFYDKYPIKLQAYNKSTHLTVEIDYAKDGRSSCIFDGECTIFPSKDQRDWTKFKRFWDKPKDEKFDVNILQPFDKVLVKDRSNEWACALFSHIDTEVPYPVYSSSGCFKFCIPYNDETKHLIGTKNDCPEYYKWWEE